MRAKRHACFANLAQVTQAEHLKTSGIGEYCPRPGHEPVQAAQLSNLLDSWPEVQVIGVAEENLNSEFLKHVLGHTFNGSNGPYGHEYGRLHFTVRSFESSGTCASCPIFNEKFDRHCWDCSESFLEARRGSVTSALTEANLRRCPSMTGRGASGLHEHYRYISSARILPSATERRPTLTGNLNLLGPALPGLK